MKEILKKIVVSIITFEAKLVLNKYQPKIVAITGSVGKTSTKEAVAAVLGRNFNIRKSQKSFNSEIGVPLVILGLENAWLDPFLWLLNIFKGLKLILFKQDYPEWLVLELGVERPKDMDYLMEYIKPHMSIITALADIPVHVEFFSGPKGVAKEKAKILKNLKLDDFAILNCDDDAVCDLAKKTKAEIVKYGFGEGSDLKASNFRVIDEGGISFKVDCDGVSIPIRVYGSFGKHNVYSALAALAVGRAAGMNFIDMSDALASYEAPAGRLKLIDGIKNSFILDDTYNSSPLALRAALEVVKDIPAKRKVVMLGDMLELGKYAIEAHKSMAKYIIESGAEIVFTVGPRSKFIAQEMRDKNFSAENIFEFSNSVDAAKKAQEVVEEDDLILIKGSQSIRMEKIVKEIMAEPERAGELLVRQEEKWLEK